MKTCQEWPLANGTPDAMIRTNWSTNDIWMRREFSLPSLTNPQKQNLLLWMRYDNSCIVYINGVKAADISGYNSGYTVTALSAEVLQTITQDRKNIIAIHCHQTSGNQFIDAGLSVIRANSK